MRRLLFASQVFFLGLFLFTSTITVLQLSGLSGTLAIFNYKKPVYNGTEEYDRSLNRLNSIARLEQYCDSLYSLKATLPTKENEFGKDYVEVVNSVIKKRFYHGYSYYGFDNNYVAFLFSKATVSGYSAIVIPDDILKHPFASCSQQSIVMMEVLKAKGFKTRKIGFFGKKYGGHFCFEVFYQGSWHFYDPNMEPDIAVLNTHQRPGISFLVSHPDILTRAYKDQSPEKIMDIFPTYYYGPVNKFPAPTGIIVQKITKVFSYLGWLFSLAVFIWIRRKYRRLITNQHVWNSRVYFPQPQAGTSSSYYPGLTTPGT